MMPEKAIKKLYQKILPVWKVCFIAAVVTGLFAYLYKITNWLPNWDSLVFRYDNQNMLSMGRWFLPVICSFGSFYDLPFFGGITAILFHALGAVVICKMFGVREKITAGLIGATVATFPTVTSVMMYNYVADGYAIAFFSATLAAYYMTKKKMNIPAAVILIALSTGIYQAYITVTVMLILFKLIDEAVFENESSGTLLKKTGGMLLTGVAGVALYFVVLKILLAVFSVELLDYQGAGSAASLSTINLPASLYVIKETFIKCFFDVSGGINVYVALNALIFVFTIAYYLKSIVRNGIHRKPMTLVLTVFLSVMLVFGACALAFVNPAVDYHNLMLMGYCVFYLLFIIVYERKAKKEKHLKIKCWVVFITSLVLIANQVVIANVSYHKAQMAYEKSYGMLVRIADRIEQTEGAQNCENILVVGALDDSEDYSVNLTPDITGITDGYILRADDESVGQSVLCSALNDYCGKDYGFISGEQKEMLSQSEEVKNMEKWPSRNCISVVDNILVIKLGNEGENK